jgi:hypothetical protein
MLLRTHLRSNPGLKRIFFGALCCDVAHHSHASRTMASVEVVISWIITSVIGLLAVFFMRKIPRSRGRPPAIITDKFGKAGTVVGSLVFLALYIVGAFVILLIMPEKVQYKLFSPAGVVVVGTVFPIVESIITVCSISTEDDKTWLQYWIAQASFSYATEFVDIIAENAPWVREHWYEFEFFFMVRFSFLSSHCSCWRFVDSPQSVPC